KITAVFACEWHALRNALVDDVCAYLSQTVNIRFAGTEVAALDRVIKQTVNAVAIVLVIFRGIDSALGRDRMRAARRILITKAFHAVTELAERRRGRTAGET